MLVVVPWAGEYPVAVERALVGEGIAPILVDCTGDDYAYWRNVFADPDEPFLVVEHDVIPWPGALAELQACPREWCAVPYRIHGAFMDGLGCTKFPAIAVDRDDWRSLHGTVERTLHARDVRVHRHWPPAAHLSTSHKARR